MWLTQKKTISNKTHRSRTDPDASLAGKIGTARQLKYKIHTTIDAKSRIIIDNFVSTGSAPDCGAYIPRIEHIEQILEFKVQEAIADRGYGTAKIFQELRKKNIVAFIPRFHKKISWEEDQKRGFRFDEKNDVVICPEGQILRFFRYQNEQFRFIGRQKICFSCPQKSSCLNMSSKKLHRKVVFRSIYQEALDFQRQLEIKDEFAAKRKERSWKIEGINAEGKNVHGMTAAKYRGLAKVQIQAYMTGLVINLKRMSKS